MKTTGDEDMDIHSKISTWGVVISVLLTSFTALPTTASLYAHGINFIVLVATIVFARRGM